VRKKCSSDHEKLLNLEADGREFAKFLRSLDRTIYSNSERSEQILVLNRMLFLTCSWRFLISNKLEQLEFKLEKNIGIEKHAGKVRKWDFALKINLTYSEKK
jgi:hypothetical protein